MLKIWTILALLFTAHVALADTTIGQLPLGSGAGTSAADSFPYVNSADGKTKRLTLADLVNLPAFSDPSFCTGKPLSGFASAPGVVSSSDSVLSALEKIVGNFNGIATAAISVGPMDSVSPSPNGQSLIANQLYAQSASTTAPGLINTGAQAFAGTKTYQDGLVGSLTGAASLNLLKGANLSDVASAASSRTNLGLDNPSNYPTLNQNTTGNAATATLAAAATKLATAGTSCAAGQYAYGIDAFTNLQCSVVQGLPSQTGNSGKYLTTDGTTPSWATVPDPRSLFSASAPLTYNSTTGAFGIPAATDSVDGYMTAAEHAQVTANTTAISGKQPAGSYAVTTNNLSDLSNVATARSNLGLGSFALKNSLVSADIPNNAANTTGNAATSTALAASPTQCAIGYHNMGIQANGNANCAQDSGGYTAPVTTKGDLFGYDTAPNRVPVGANGYILTADSTQALGLKWAPPAATGVTAVNATAPVASSGGTTPTISMAQSSSTVDGYLSKADWATFNGKANAFTPANFSVGSGLAISAGTGTGAVLQALTVGIAAGYYLPTTTDQTNWNAKQAALTFSAPLVNSSNTVSIPVATSSANGYLSNTDWATFNAKQAAGNYATNGSGDVAWTAPAGGGAVTTTIQPGAVTTSKMADSSVTPGKLTSQAINVDGINNLSVKPLFSSGAMSIGLLDAVGGSLSATNPGFVNFRQTGTPTDATPVQVKISSNVSSLNVANGSKLGFSALNGTPLYVYLTYGLGAVNLGISGADLDPTQLYTGVATSSTSAPYTSLFMNVAGATVSVRKIGKFIAYENLVGFWDGGTTTPWDMSAPINGSSGPTTIQNGGLYLGEVKFTGCSSNWTQPSTSWADFGAVTGCTCVAVGPNVTCPTNGLPGALVNVPGAGSVTLEGAGSFAAEGVTSPDIYWRASDGTNNSLDEMQASNAGSSSNRFPYLSSSLNYTAAATGVTVRWQARSAYGTATIYSNGAATANPNVFRVKWTPGLSQQAGTIITKNPQTSQAAVMAGIGTSARVTSWPTGACAPGTYRAYTKTSTSNPAAWADSAPGTLPSANSGFLLTTAALQSSTDGAGFISRYEICIGQNKAYKVNFWPNANKAGRITATAYYSGNGDYGVYDSYDASTGILLVDKLNLGEPNLYVGYVNSNSTGGTGATSVTYSTYFDVITYDNPLAAGLSFAQDEVWLAGGAGYGSTNTAIRRYASILNQRGSALTLTQSATLGDSITVNTSGVYAVSFAEYNSGNSAPAVTGIIKNPSGALTIGSLSDTTPANTSGLVTGLSYTVNGTVNVGGGQGSTTLNLVAGDVLRVGEFNQQQSATTAARISFRVTKIPDPLTTANSAGTGNVVAARGPTKISFARVTGAAGDSDTSRCTGTCYANASSGDITSVVRGGTGFYTINLTGYTVIPHCFFTQISGASGFGFAALDTITPTSIQLETRTYNNANQDASFEVMCSGY